MSRIDDSKALWKNKLAQKYPFHAESPVSVKPPLVDKAIGPSGSVVMRIGWRTWGFHTVQERDLFCAQFGGFPLP